MKTLQNILKSLFFIFIITSCELEEAPLELQVATPIDTFNSGPVCFGTKILEFNNLDDIQQEHLSLYTDYQTNGEDEQTLRDYEDAKSFYSLRKKDEEMDEGLIPSEPDFDPFDYTSDEILETLLNKDGMVIIDQYLYLWDDGCVIQRIPFSCDNYQVMLAYKEFVKTTTGSLDSDELNIFVNENGIEDIEICSDPRFDFESISETGKKIDNRTEPRTKSGAGCGFQNFITHQILSHDPFNQTASIRFEATSIEPAGSNPKFSFYIDNSSDFQSVEIVGGSIPSLVNSNWAINGGDGYAYPGKWFVVDIDYSNIATLVPFVNISLVGAISLLSGESCLDTDNLFIDLSCPITLSKEPINAQTGEWSFSIQGLPAGSFGIDWVFGDGNSSVTSVNSTTHQYAIPCEWTNYTVTAIIKGEGLCKTSVSTSVPVGNPCYRDVVFEKDNTHTISGKKVRLKIKMRKKAGIFGGGTKFKNKFRCRATGTKNINASGIVMKVTGNNCDPVNIDSFLTPESQNGKKKLKQKYSSGVKYKLDLNNPYNVTFSHSSGFNFVMSDNETCSQ